MKTKDIFENENHSNNDNCYNIDKIVDFLLKNGVDPNIPDNAGIYPLQHAFKCKKKN